MTPESLDAQGPATGPDTGPAADLTIGDVARLTGLTAPVLRMWESRHGFPTAHRLGSGHRRYDAAEVELVRQVVRRRDAGIRLDIAIAEARASTPPSSPSVFATLRTRHPGLAPYRLRKSTLLALSWALEDECCAAAQSPVLFGAFQGVRFWRPAVPRWHELARVARSTMVFADFDQVEGAGRAGAPVLVPLGADAPMRREWVVVCDAVERTAVLAAWELPGQGALPDRDRIFEAVWTVDPQAVRDAARVCADVAASAGVAAAVPLQQTLAADPVARSVDLAGSTALFNRIVAYVDRLGG